MKDMEEEIDRLREKLPNGYMVNIEISNLEANLYVVTPDRRKISLEGDSETCWSMLLSDALGCALVDFDENLEHIKREGFNLD